MISYRHADLLDRIKRKLFEESRPQVGDAVYVHPAEPDDQWSVAFNGKIDSIDQRGVFITDGHGNRFLVEERKFDLLKNRKNNA